MANRDLIEEASDLDGRVKDLGNVKIVWVPRSQNELADKCCNEELGAMDL